MKDDDLTKEQLIEELAAKRRQVAELKKLETEHKRTKEVLRRKTQELEERLKELNCLYRLSELLTRADISLDEIFEVMVNLIPPAWQYPAITCAKITYKDREFKTDNFKTTKWKQLAEIKSYEKNTGAVEVYYLEESPEIDVGPFLKEEQSLLNVIAEQLGRIIGRKLVENALKDSESKLQKQKEALELKNIALMEILSQVETEKKKIKEDVITNVDKLLLPILKKIRIGGGACKYGGDSCKYLDLLEHDLQELTSPFGSKISEKKAKLTPREIEICNMIKNGLMSKEISRLLSVSTQTIEKHRAKIRHKLDISNTDFNLTSFLQTL